MREKNTASLRETIKTVVYAVLIAMVIRTFGYEPFNIPSGSMIPTLLVGGYPFVSKYSYGYSRYSLPFGLNLISGRIFGSLPERGDVAVFKLPRDGETDYIKRLVGLPGDRIQVVHGILQINGQPVERTPVEPYRLEDRLGDVMFVDQYIETLPGGRKHPIIELSDDGPLDNTPVYEVPEGHVFAMGDNRDNSLDSRVAAGVGYVPIENLVGRAEFLFFSMDESAHWWEFWKWPGAIRYGRLFQRIH